GRSDSCAPRHPTLVRSLRRTAHPRHPPVSEFVGLGASLYRERRRPRLPTGVLWLRLYRTDGDSPRVSFSLSAAGVRVVLLDIEGTTTPIDFVYGTLFPFARQRVQTYLDAAASVDPEIEGAVEDLHKQHEQDAAAGQMPPGWLDQPGDARIPSAVAYIHWLMD